VDAVEGEQFLRHEDLTYNVDSEEFSRPPKAHQSV
jgi:hypothetical protein